MNGVGFLGCVDFNGCKLPPQLPLVHTVDFMVGMEYIKNLSLTKPLKKCEVFPDDNPVYLFYGKPAYKKLDEGTTSDPAAHPMVFIFKNNPPNLKKVLRVFPFDSGAFHKGRFKNYIDPAIYSFKDFQLNTDVCELSKHIYFFWENNTAYFKGKKPKYIDDSGLSFAIGAYAKLIEARCRTSFDDRCSVPEIQSEEIICILDNLQAIIVSEDNDLNFLTGSMRETFKKKDIKIIPYETYGRVSPTEKGPIYTCVLKYYKEKGML